MKIPSGAPVTSVSSTPPTPFTADQLESLARWMRSKGFGPAVVSNPNELNAPLMLAFQAGRHEAVAFLEREAKAQREQHK